MKSQKANLHANLIWIIGVKNPISYYLGLFKNKAPLSAVFFFTRDRINTFKIHLQISSLFSHSIGKYLLFFAKMNDAIFYIW